MRHFSRYSTLLAMTALALMTTLGGCAKIGEAIDCEQMCEEMQTCIDGDLNVNRCSDRCEDKADNDHLRSQLDACTDCLDHNYACGELHDECPVCDEVTEALL